MNRTDMNKQIKGYKTGDAVEPPKSLIKAMVEEAATRKDKSTLSGNTTNFFF